MAPMLPDDYASYRRDLVVKATHVPVGVFEALVLANGRYPDWPASKRLELAEHVIRDIATTESARFFWGDWHDPASETSIATDVLPGVLREWSTWVTQDGPLAVWFTIGEKTESTAATVVTG